MAEITFGLAYASSGDPQTAVEILERTLERARQANSHLIGRAYVNLASVSSTAGDLGRSAQLHREGVAQARRFGSRLDHWLVVECALDDYIAGDWDAAVVGARSYLEHRGAAQFMDTVAYHVFAATAAGRGDGPAASAHAHDLLESARENREPQTLLCTLGECARLALDAGDHGQARSLVDELAAAYSTFESFEIDVAQIAGFLAAAALGCADELNDRLERVAYDTPWVEACRRIAEGRFDEAGEILRSRGAHVYAAMVELLAAERAGAETPGLRDAIAFFERVGATAYLARAAHLVQASA